MSLLILRRECGAVYPLGVVVNLIGAAGGGNGTTTGWRASLRRSGHSGQHGDMVPEGDTKALQQFAMYIGYARVTPDQNLTTQQQACSR